MKLSIVKTEELIKELLDRLGDQLADPEPQWDDIFSYMTKDEMDWLIGELSAALDKRKERALRF